MSWEELSVEISNGGRLVVYQYCVSVVHLTFLENSQIHLVRGGESAVAKSWRYILLSMLAGWWGIPWGFVYTPMAIGNNLRGGKDVTADLAEYLP